jgi:predicted transposase YbfD/YdcC
MPVSHALSSVMTSTDEQAPGLLGVLARVRDPRRRRGRRFALVFVLAVAVVCVLAGAKNFREIGDQAADLPQDLLAALGGRPHPLWRRIIAPSEKRIRTLLQALDAAALDAAIGGWLRALAAAGKLDGLLTAIAIDGKWLRGVADGQVKLFAAMLHEDKVMIAQHRIPDDTNEITQVKELLAPVDLTGAVITADAAHAQHDTAAYIAGPAADGGRESDYLLAVEHASHCSCCLSWRVKQSSLAVSDLDTQAFAASLGEVDGVELAALDLVQHGLAGDAEVAGGLAEGQPAVGCLGPDAVAELLVDADLPGCSGGELLAGDEAVAEPPVDGGGGDAELPCGLADADHGCILAAGGDIFGRRLVSGDAVVGA